MIADLMFWAFVFFLAIGMIFNKLGREIDDGVLTDRFWPNAKRTGETVYSLYVVCWCLAFIALASCALASFMERM